MEFYTADICDKYGNQIQVLEPNYKSYGGKTKSSGKIVTIKLFEDNSDLVTLLRDNQGDGRVVVVDVQGDYCAVVGDNLMKFANKNNWAAIVINGYVRDTIETAKIPVGLWALGTYPQKSKKKAKAELNTKISFAGVEFVPDEYLYADSDGIITKKSPAV